MTASWNTESTEATDATPTVAGPSWIVQKANAYLQASFEVIADSDLGAEVVMLLADAKANLEADAFAVGTGGGQPYGAVTRAASLGDFRQAYRIVDRVGLSVIYDPLVIGSNRCHSSKADASATQNAASALRSTVELVRRWSRHSRSP